MTLRRATSIGALLALCLAACASTPLEQRGWIEARSANFTILTDLPREQAVALSDELELFRAVVRELTNAGRFEPRVPTRIYAFGGPREFQAILGSSGVAGFFSPRQRDNIVALDADGSGIQARQILFHEYTHFLLHNQNALVLPRWYDEGFAEFMRTLRIGPETVFIGAAPMDRKRAARYGRAIRTSKLIRARSFHRWTWRDVSMFYLQSWQLVHYFMLGPGSQRGHFGQQLRAYIRMLERGEDEERVFETIFGMGFSDLDGEIRAYNRLPAIPAVEPPRSAFEPESGGEVRDVPIAEMAAQLGFLALRMERTPQARSYFERALAADPALARAHAGLGAVKMAQGDFEAANVDFARAVELAPGDYENHLDLAAALLQRVEEERWLEGVPRVRRHAAQAIELAPSIPEGHATLGTSYVMTENEDPKPGIESLERARALLPGNLELQLPLARLYARTGEREKARVAARRVARWSHGEISDEAQALLEELGEAE